jgi:hypothetical protein
MDIIEVGDVVKLADWFHHGSIKGVILGYHRQCKNVFVVGVLNEDFIGHNADGSGVEIPLSFRRKCYNVCVGDVRLTDNSI